VVFIVWLAGRIFIPPISVYLVRCKERRKLKKLLEERLSIFQKVSRLFVVLRKIIYSSNSPCELKRRIYIVTISFSDNFFYTINGISAFNRTIRISVYLEFNLIYLFQFLY